MIKVISFDIGGTLLLSENNKDYNLKSLANLVNVEYSKVRIAYKEIFQKKKANFEALEKLFCERLEIPLTIELHEFFINKFFSSETEVYINLEIANLIKKLKKQGYVIILFSNSCCLIENKIDTNLLNNIDYIFYSYDLGYTKSDKESYRLIEKQLGYNSNQFLHIGDTYSSDYLKPKENGWEAFLYDNKEKKTENLEKIYSLIKNRGI